ncbi:DNA cytosine methyltransferase [Pedobacter gandavensis]|uniref:DNA cytosine methyltransferase n=1 Tax=Pedobacter gandavensis TaxID=2679963 RepID=UPI00292ED404|nr:DNA cytosine methyltransferase [Pedobacter gandavensis]
MLNKGIPIIDLFAGPGGLAEGFSSLVDDNNQRYFNIKISIEKDSHARETLKLRSFVRQFPYRLLPDEYYQFLQRKITLDELYGFYPDEAKEANSEAWQAILGETSESEIDERIKNALNGAQDWVLIGGPPCQAYSMAGRSRVGGIAEDDHRVHLYKEYLRIIALHQPSVFVMENVKGLLSAEVNNEKIFPKILDDLEDPSSVFPDYISSKYRIRSLVVPEVKKHSDYLIKSEEYGIPQKRHRVILLGIRSDINEEPDFLIKKTKVDLKSIIGQIPMVRSGVYRQYINTDEIIMEDGTVKKKRNYKTIKDSFEVWEKLILNFRKDLGELLPKVVAVQSYPKNVGVEFKPYLGNTLSTGHSLYKWFIDEKIGGILHHVSRGHLTLDLKRYLFASSFTLKTNKFPRMEDYIKYGLQPDHDNVGSGKFNDRFRVQIPNEPATTVTSHISKDGHYFIHYDSVQCRSLTVREAARIQTFPDNYFFCGSRTQQFHQVGNAVPPYLAYQIAKIVYKLLVPNNRESEL